MNNDIRKGASFINPGAAISTLLTPLLTLPIHTHRNIPVLLPERKVVHQVPTARRPLDRRPLPRRRRGKINRSHLSAEEPSLVYRRQLLRRHSVHLASDEQGDAGRGHA